MGTHLSDKYILSLAFVTLFLIISYEIGTLFTNNGFYVIPVSFGYLGFLVSITSAIRTIYPQVRKSGLYQFVMLFDVTALAQIIRNKMNQIKGKGKKKRQTAMVVGTPTFILSMFGLIRLVFLGGRLTSIDLINATTAYIPSMIQEITNGAWFILMILLSLVSASIVLIGYGYYDMFRRWKSVNEFLEETII
jgi:hypothetical protein